MYNVSIACYLFLFSFFLLKSTGDIALVPHVSLDNVQLIDQAGETEQDFQKLLTNLFQEREDTEAQIDRKEKLITWLQTNHLRIENSPSNSAIVIENGVALIQPPFTIDTCESTNEIVLDRVRALVESCPF